MLTRYKVYHIQLRRMLRLKFRFDTCGLQLSERKNIIITGKVPLNNLILNECMMTLQEMLQDQHNY